MKTKVIILSAAISILTFTVASTQSAKQPQALKRTQVSAPRTVGQGYAMEDKNQFIQ